MCVVYFKGTIWDCVVEGVSRTCTSKNMRVKDSHVVVPWPIAGVRCQVLVSCVLRLVAHFQQG
jgi:hypothetical protein